MLEVILHELSGDAVKADRKSRLRSLKDLDEAAATLASACQMLLDDTVPDAELRKQLFARISPDALALALAGVNKLIRPTDNVYYQELDSKYKTVRRFLPALAEHIQFGANAAGEPFIAAFAWLRANMTVKRPSNDAPRDIITKPWQRHVLRENDAIDFHAYAFCVLSELRVALRRRDVFVAPSWRYADPRAGLLDSAEWESKRPIICRTLGLSAVPGPTLTALADELDRTYQAVAARLPDNPAVRFDRVGDKQEPVLSPLDKMDEPASLIALRAKVMGMLPRVDLPELILEIAARTRFTDAFTHISERTARFRSACHHLRRVDGRGLQHGTGAVDSRRRAGAQTRQVVLGGPELSARRHNHGSEHHAGRRAEPFNACQRVGTRPMGGLILGRRQQSCTDGSLAL